MSKALPTGGFKWLDIEEVKEIEKMLQSVDGVEDYKPLEDRGRVFQVDIIYHKGLHDKHNDFPFLPQHIGEANKLIPNLFDKRYYTLNEHNLIQALKHGLILVRIHKILEFDQSTWLKDYIDFNTELRAKSKNTFKKISLN